MQSKLISLRYLENSSGAEQDYTEATARAQIRFIGLPEQFSNFIFFLNIDAKILGPLLWEV